MYWSNKQAKVPSLYYPWNLIRQKFVFLHLWACICACQALKRFAIDSDKETL